MKRNVLILTAVVAALSLTTSAWAGGSWCSGKGKSEGAAKQTAAGSRCTPGKSGASVASKQCPIGADNAVFSFAVPSVHCGLCVDKIQTTAMAQKGVLCAEVDLDTKTAYVAGDKKLNQKAIAKAIKEAGYTCTFKAQGAKVRAELMKIMASSMETTPTATKKDKV